MLNVLSAWIFEQTKIKLIWQIGSISVLGQIKSQVNGSITIQELTA